MAILDADKEGYLRSHRSRFDWFGGRHVGSVSVETTAESMQRVIETASDSACSRAYNANSGTPSVEADSRWIMQWEGVAAALAAESPTEQPITGNADR